MKQGIQQTMPGSKRGHLSNGSRDIVKDESKQGERSSAEAAMRMMQEKNPESGLLDST